ncbi:MAG: hypothetical protein D3910_04645 [Candidatus Electrothrix sp. ATG2]|nr:hypothetical protein [Candidatus Electrothrix sp. ATG2]
MLLSLRGRALPNNRITQRRKYIMDAVLEQLLEDAGDLPKEMHKEALNFVHFLKSKLPSSRSQAKEHRPNGENLVRLLQEASGKKLFSHIQNPVAWQQGLRRDRPLPERED